MKYPYVFFNKNIVPYLLLSQIIFFEFILELKQKNDIK